MDARRAQLEAEVALALAGDSVGAEEEASLSCVDDGNSPNTDVWGENNGGSGAFWDSAAEIKCFGSCCGTDDDPWC